MKEYSLFRLLNSLQRVRRSSGVKLSDYSDAWARKEFTEKPPLPGSGMCELGLVCQE